MSQVKIKWRGDLALKIAEEAARDALFVSGESLLTDAIDKTPIETGTLRRSGTVTVGGKADSTSVYKSAKSGTDQSGAHPAPISDELTAYVSFNTPYAKAQHEATGFNHPKGGGAKYLENPFKSKKSKMQKYINLAVIKALRDSR